MCYNAIQFSLCVCVDIMYYISVIIKTLYHIIYKSSNRNKVRDKFGITYFEKLITMQIRSRD